MQESQLVRTGCNGKSVYAVLMLHCKSIFTHMQQLCENYTHAVSKDIIEYLTAFTDGLLPILLNHDGAFQGLCGP